VVDPGPAPAEPVKPPSDAIVLFDGKDLSKWEAAAGRGAGGAAPEWKVENGVATVAGRTSIRTKEKFGDIQLHLEWAEPNPPKGTSQGRGNSGVIIMGRFETQVLDSYKADTYADGQCGAVYGQYPPLVNACRPPGEWQTYDIIFHKPRYKDGKLERPARITVIQNGVVVQADTEYFGPTGHNIIAKWPESPLPDEAPLSLQNHGGDKVQYRNVWVRRLDKLEEFQKGQGAPLPAEYEVKK
jgi:3-keto-disaccharide hydrolase